MKNIKKVDTARRVKIILEEDATVVSYKRLVLFFLFLRERGNVHPG